MTTIAWDGKTLATDSQCSMHKAPVTKIWHSPNGKYVMAGSGDYGAVLALRDHIAVHGITPWDPKRSEAQIGALVVDRAANQCYHYDNTGYPAPCLTPFAEGSGADYATGAMIAGKNAAEAVAIAIQLDYGSGGEIQTS